MGVAGASIAFRMKDEASEALTILLSRQAGGNRPLDEEELATAMHLVGAVATAPRYCVGDFEIGVHADELECLRGDGTSPRATSGSSRPLSAPSSRTVTSVSGASCDRPDDAHARHRPQRVMVPDDAPIWVCATEQWAGYWASEGEARDALSNG